MCALCKFFVKLSPKILNTCLRLKFLKLNKIIWTKCIYHNTMYYLYKNCNYLQVYLRFTINTFTDYFKDQAKPIHFIGTTKPTTRNLLHKQVKLYKDWHQKQWARMKYWETGNRWTHSTTLSIQSSNRKCNQMRKMERQKGHKHLSISWDTTGVAVTVALTKEKLEAGSKMKDGTRPERLKALEIRVWDRQ